MLSLTLLRHASTHANHRDQLCGRADVALSERGIRQAQSLGESLGPTPWSRVVSSPLQRARRTAQAVCSAARIPLHLEARLMEIDYGRWEGRSIRDLWQVDLGFQRFRADPEGVCPPHGESLAQVAARAVAVVRELEHALFRGHLKDGPVLLVSHKTTVRALTCALTGRPLRDYRKVLWEPGQWVRMEPRAGGWVETTRGP